MMPLSIFVDNRSTLFKFLSMLIRREMNVLYLCVFIAVDMKYQINVPHSCSTKSSGCHDRCKQRETDSHSLTKRVEISRWPVASLKDFLLIDSTKREILLLPCISPAEMGSFNARRLQLSLKSIREKIHYQALELPISGKHCIFLCCGQSSLAPS